MKYTDLTDKEIVLTNKLLKEVLDKLYKLEELTSYKDKNISKAINILQEVKEVTK